MPSLFITGANRGLGLEFVRQFATMGWEIHATCRDVEQAETLRRLAESCNGRIKLHPLDIGNAQSIAALPARLKGVQLDLLINNAGILDTTAPGFTEGTRETLQALGSLNYEDWAKVLLINTLGPIRLTETLLPFMRDGSAKITMLSSALGSISINDPAGIPPGGGIYYYRSSKAALNMAVRSLASDIKSRGICVFSLSPGWVKTEMGGTIAPMEKEQSVAGMIEAIMATDIVQTGSFISYDQNAMPW
jgi:NAD(P)-dependent dehydrogenase (short-subunit alcohol dehydrogenase family)